MTVIRTFKNKENPYVMLNRAFFDDKRLSLKAKGLLGYCMSKPDNWKFRINHMITELKEGKEALWTAFKELIEAGYCFRYQEKNKGSGKFQCFEYMLFETPQSLEELKERLPHWAFPCPDNPGPVNPPLISNEDNNNDSTNIYCAGKASAKVPRKEVKVVPIKKERRVNISTSEEEHNKLSEKYGEQFTQLCYSYLSEWKISKEEVDPKSVNKHTDYYRIVNWVAKKLKEEQEQKTKKPQYQEKKQENYENKQPKEMGYYNSETRKHSPLANYKF
jgi:hypothetical protein